jgi:hypothetical protein
MGYELVQVNVARLHALFDAPEMAGFVAAIDPVLRLAPSRWAARRLASGG